MKRVAFWVASGGQYIEEASGSAGTLKAHMPDIPCVLVTDTCCGAIDHFDCTVAIESDLPHWYLKSIQFYRYAISELPYHLFLAFDTDIHVCAPIYDLYEVLERFDFVGCHAPRRNPFAVSPCVPAAFSTVNVGVLGFRRSHRTLHLLDDWLETAKDHYRNYEEQGYAFFTDQVPLRIALWNSSVRLWIAPTEYNCRFDFGVYADGLVRVLHGRHTGGVPESINSYDGARIWHRETGLITT